MPDLIPQSTPPTPTNSDPTEPPPFPWEDHPAFRFTFLLHFTQPGDREALEYVGRLLYDGALECANKWPDWKESPTRAELRAVLADLRHIEGFLLSIAAERQHTSLSPEDEQLAFLAGEYARQARSLAFGLQSIAGLPLGVIFR
jgi:hypothetical protein